MNVTTGTKLGPYEIVSRLGAGGMGEVWRATDTRLDRSVAIKVLPAELAQNAQLKARFEREAKTISQLNHPNICSLFDVGDGYLVMELLEGEALTDRLARGPLPLAEVLKYGSQIADALDRAHRAGITHRDLKPGNVMITRSGAKLLDFGLAKSAAPVVDLEGATQHRPLTQEGTILGTFQYMAPEQLEGQEADARTDIFALGAVLYEMASAKRAFEGKTRTSLIAAIVSSDPRPISEVQPLTPPAFERVLRKCLAKEPDDRWQSAHDIADELRWIGESGSQAASTRGLMTRPRRRERLTWMLAVLAILLATAAAVHWKNRERGPQRLRLSIPAPEGTTFARPTMPIATISPDGTRVVFSAQSANGESMLYVRSLQEFEARPLSGTEQGETPFFSPDGKWIGFCADGKLRKVLATGGNVTDIAPAPSITGADWREDGLIAFTLSYNTGIYVIPSSGGTPRQVSAPDRRLKESSHGWPQFLPGGNWIIFTVESSGKSFNDATIVAQSLDNGERRVLVRGGTCARYVPSGHLVFARSSSLFAVPFDANKVAVTGSPVEVMKGVVMTEGRGVSQWSFSRTGTLLFTPGPEISSDDILGYADQAGTFTPLTKQLNGYNALAMSPDGKTIAFLRRWSDDDIWIHDIDRDVQTRVTFVSEHMNPIWTSDGHSLIFGSDRDGAMNLYAAPPDGTGVVERLTKSSNWQAPSSISPAGLLAYTEEEPETKSDIWLLPLTGDRKPQALIQTPFDDYDAQFSPDGKWLAWVSNDSGRAEVYARSMADGGKWQVSTAGGDEPRWSRDGKEIFYRIGDQMMAVDVTPGSSLHVARPRTLFDAPYLPGNRNKTSLYDVTPDGRFVVARKGPGVTLRELRVVFNWFDELRERSQ